jgi:phage-related protein
MATFPSIAPTFNAVKSSQPAIKTTKFGDGYEQRTTFGLNQNPKEWSLTFMVNATDSATIEDFLDARAADAASFDWTPPDDTTSYKWRCDQWSKDLLGDSFFKISATFRQVYEP